MSIAIIGAGMAGLSCARALTQAGETVTVFEKSRGIGGRCATRRSDQGNYDHGAPYAEAWTVNFKAVLAAAATTGFAREWPEKTLSDAVPAFVGVPGMSALAKPLAMDTELKLASLVKRVERQAGSWVLLNEADASLGAFTSLCLAIPAPQAAVLLAPHPFVMRAATAVMSPCWTLMAHVVDEFDFAIPVSEPIWKVIAESRKAERAPEPCRIVAHMTPAWTRAHLELDAADAAGLISKELVRQFDVPERSFTFAKAHRWRYALTEKPLGEPCLWDEDQKLGVCGDWCLGPNVEDAFLSGSALADRMLRRA